MAGERSTYCYESCHWTKIFVDKRKCFSCLLCIRYITLISLRTQTGRVNAIGQPPNIPQTLTCTPNSFPRFSATSCASFELLKYTFYLKKIECPTRGQPVNNSHSCTSVGNSATISVSNPAVSPSDDDAFVYGEANNVKRKVTYALSRTGKVDRKTFRSHGMLHTSMRFGICDSRYM